jgi:hypothetical protein
MFICLDLAEDMLKKAEQAELEDKKQAESEDQKPTT